MVLKYVLSGYTDEELLQISKADPAKLKIEELLFTANELVKKDDYAERLRIYEEVIKKDENEWRALNNAGTALYMMGKKDDAAKMFEKAKKAAGNAITNNNAGVILRQDGKIDEAAQLFSASTSAGSDVSYNLGLVNIAKGEYDAAIKNMGTNETFNKALAQTLKKDHSNAVSTLKNAPEANTAMGYYLMAILGARTGSETQVIDNLKKAITADSSLKAKAMKDREFIKYFENEAFKAL